MPLPAVVAGAVWSVIAIPLVVKILLGLGIGFISYQGITLLTDSALEFIRSNLAGMPADVVAVIAITKIDVYFTMIFSAYAIKLTLKGLDSTGVLRKLSFSAG